jgi:ribosome maturation factor RimP
LRLLAIPEKVVKLLQIADVMLVFLIALWILCNNIVNKSVCSYEAGLFCPLFYFSISNVHGGKGKLPDINEISSRKLEPRDERSRVRSVMASTLSLISKKVTDLIEPIIDGMCIELVDVEYVSNQGRWILRIYIDKAGGITVDDCARVSHEIEDLIDVKEIIEHEYVLEVSSPGLNRPLKKEKDFIRALDKKIKVRMAVPVMGRRNFTGYLKKFQAQTLYLEMESGHVTLPWREIDKANLVYEFTPKDM